MTMKFADLRRDYLLSSLDESSVAQNPVDQFAIWFEEARAASGREPNAMTLATASPSGEPSARVVLLKHFDERGFVFFSSYNSPKGIDLEKNPRVALVFYWPESERQVRILGSVERTSSQEAAEYFSNRPRGSQLAAHIARQSQVIAGREPLEAEMAEIEARFEGRAVTPPDVWGGFRVVPNSYEFWQGRPNRLHDRIRYRRQDHTWLIERLAP
jgi:pyridoxamine 5'-phosphate oxidase